MVLVGAYLALAIPLWLIGAKSDRVGGDQDMYHLPTIRLFAEQWPRPDLHDYQSATTPGYHLLLAAVAKYVDDHSVTLQLFAALFTVLMLSMFGVLVARRASVRTTGGGNASAGADSIPWFAIAAALPVIGSQYVSTAGIWLLPDNAGWLGVIIVLGLALSGRVSRRVLIGAAVALALLVCVRQNHIWVAGALVLAAWLGEPKPTDDVLGYPPLSSRDLRLLVSEPTNRARRALAALLACVPAIAVLAAFVLTWHGLVPPSFQGQLKGGNAAAPAFALALLGIYGVFYGGYLVQPLMQIMLTRPLLLVGLLALALAAALVPSTLASIPNNFGGLWSIVAKMPTIGGHTSVLILVLAIVGMLTLVSLLVGCARRDRWVLLAALAGFIAAQSASAVCYQRYMEPLLLIVLGLGAAGIHARLSPAWRWERAARVVGPMLLFVMLAGIAVWAVLKGI